ncbi:potassium-transporting ATPase subunit KdpC [Paracoccus tibetensis]|uniref:Potassium-transporting ATPase KdpC subunit n=1 Tax=Paracoccus tibetensis TaxID=336292 RepID=A0A1G5J5H6_9RHOB|nr:potassium-transporting ATPase subunit KdpC [Paracoccus tibetensis]SCY83615.1 K+-transporting ATPase ATPase C chain [Paracoccus tibetensis]
MNEHIRPALATLGLMVVLTGLAYPLAITGLGQALMPQQANASLIERNGRIVGSALVGQAFAAPRYLHPRPSAVDYDAAAAGASNLGPTSAELLALQVARAEAFRAETGAARVPVDAVTASASGLDPHVSPQNALAQAARIAAARGAPEAAIRSMIASHVEPPLLGLFGEPRVNVLSVNLALDAAFPLAATLPETEG